MSFQHCRRPKISVSGPFFAIFDLSTVLKWHFSTVEVGEFPFPVCFLRYKPTVRDAPVSRIFYYVRSCYSAHSVPVCITIFKNTIAAHSEPFHIKYSKKNFFSNFHDFFKFILSEWQLIENATSARGEFWESVFLKHSSILSIGLVPAALVL